MASNAANASIWWCHRANDGRAMGVSCELKVWTKFQIHFLQWKYLYLIRILLKSAPKGPIDNKPAPVKITTWRGTGNKRLSEPMVANWQVTRPRWYLWTWYGTNKWFFDHPWWRHQTETFSVLLALCEGKPPVTFGFPYQRPVTRTFGFFYLRLNKRLSNRSRRRWCETPSHPLWRHSNVEIKQRKSINTRLGLIGNTHLLS